MCVLPWKVDYVHAEISMKFLIRFKKKKKKKFCIVYMHMKRHNDILIYPDISLKWPSEDTKLYNLDNSGSASCFTTYTKATLFTGDFFRLIYIFSEMYDRSDSTACSVCCIITSLTLYSDNVGGVSTD